VLGWVDSVVVGVVEVDTTSDVVVVTVVVVDWVEVEVEAPSGLISGTLEGVAARSSSQGGRALAVVAAELAAAGSQV